MGILTRFFVAFGGIAAKSAWLAQRVANTWRPWACRSTWHRLVTSTKSALTREGDRGSFLESCSTSSREADWESVAWDPMPGKTQADRIFTSTSSLISDWWSTYSETTKKRKDVSSEHGCLSCAFAFVIWST